MKRGSSQGSSMTAAKLWLGATVTGAIGYALFIARSEVYILGLIVLACLTILTITFTVLGVMYGIKKYRAMDAIDIGQYGTIVQIGRTIQTFGPVGVMKALPENTVDATVEPIIPTIDDLIDNGTLGLGKLVLGFRKDGSIRNGSWDELRTFAVAGISASGKSTTLFFIIVQMLLNMAEVYVCDPHKTKQRGILSMLRPVWGYIHKAGTKEEIKTTVDNFYSELNRRIDGGTYLSPVVLVIDEWTQLAVDKAMLALIIAAVELTARAGAGYDVYCIISGHLWQPSACGGSRVKDSLHASIVHRLAESQSRHLLDRRFSKHTPQLGVGTVFVYDTQGDTELCIMPNRTDRTGARVAELLKDGGVTEIIEEQLPEIASPNASTTQPLRSIVDSKCADDELETAIQAYKDGAKSINKLAQALSTGGKTCSRHRAGQIWAIMKERGIVNG